MGQVEIRRRHDWPRGGLWRESDFLMLWSAQAIRALGNRITRTALPILAVLSTSSWRGSPATARIGCPRRGRALTPARAGWPARSAAIRALPRRTALGTQNSELDS